MRVQNKALNSVVDFWVLREVFFREWRIIETERTNLEGDKWMEFKKFKILLCNFSMAKAIRTIF